MEEHNHWKRRPPLQNGFAFLKSAKLKDDDDMEEQQRQQGGHPVARVTRLMELLKRAKVVDVQERNSVNPTAHPAPDALPSADAVDPGTANFSKSKLIRNKAIRSRMASLFKAVLGSWSKSLTSRPAEESKDRRARHDHRVLTRQQLLTDKVQLLREALAILDKLRAGVSAKMPAAALQRARESMAGSKCGTAAVDGDEEVDDSFFPFVMGRCFNLSVNLKILDQCNYVDSVMGSRVFSDIDALEKHTRKAVASSEILLLFRQLHEPRDLEAAR